MISGRSRLRQQSATAAIPSGSERTTDRPVALLEESGRVVERLGLDVLRQRDRDCAGLGRVW